MFNGIYAQSDTGRLSLSLEECLQYAESNNFSLQSGGINVSTSELNLKQAKENLAPSVSASATQGFNF
ncbi:MAG: hypothetical protein IKN32_07530, partial [Bacteroidales bacterium]|nr:hypothetical protein [Bacteroidales bacterium]